MAELCRQLEDSSAEQQRALELVARLRLAPEVEHQIIGLARGLNNRLAAKAATLLGSIRSDDARRTALDSTIMMDA